MKMDITKLLIIHFSITIKWKINPKGQMDILSAIRGKTNKQFHARQARINWCTVESAASTYLRAGRMPTAEE